MPSVRVATRSASASTICGFGVCDELELAERLFELLAHAVERSVRVGGDHRADELEREADRSRLERGQARREPERVAVQLLVDVHAVTVERGVDRVTAAAEVDEVQQLEVLFELLCGNVEALDDLGGRDDGLMSFAARGEQVGEECLEHGEAFRHDRTGGALAEGFGADGRRGVRARLRRGLLVALAYLAQCPCRPRGGARRARSESRGRPGGGSTM